jgi:thioredoxin reductase
MQNFKFTSLLAVTPLSDEDKYNLTVIFSAMKPERQLDIIENWPNYLDRILQIHGKAEDERKRQIQETFTRINQMIDDAYLKEQENKHIRAEEQSKKDADMIAAMEYDQKRKIASIRQKEQAMQIAREKLLDPLAFI